MNFLDTHSHFNLCQFDPDREEAIARMVADDVGTFCVGVDRETSELAVELANKNDNIWAIVGQHPTEWCKEWDMDAMRALAGKTKVVAIGECGLDYFRLPAQAGERERGQKETQKKLFRAQIELAIETKLPLMLHIRPSPRSDLGETMSAGLIKGDAYYDALAILNEYKTNHPQLTGTAHFFVGNKEIAQSFLDLGFYISFSGVITIFSEYEEVVRYVPLERILPETDAPFASPLPWRGKRCEPQYVKEVIKKIAEIKQVSLEQTERQLLENTKQLFYKNLNFR